MEHADGQPLISNTLSFLHFIQRLHIKEYKNQIHCYINKPMACAISG